MDSIPLETDITYGPIESRRLGRSLGINILPFTLKVCSFNCLYCQYGATKYPGYTAGGYLEPNLPEIELIMGDIESALKRHLDVDYITFTGNGEATVRPDFPEIVEFTVKMRDRYAKDVKTAILSNSSTVNIPSIRESLMLVDAPIMKLDAGDAKTFSILNGPVRGIDFEQIIRGLSKMECIIQTLFVEGEVQNSQGEALGRWVEALEKLNPVQVQIYSLDRPHADPRIGPVNPERLEEIARFSSRRTGLDIVSFYR